MLKSFAALAAMAAILPATAQAQAARPMLDYATAAKIRDTCVEWAGSRKLQMAIAVYDDGGKLLAFAHMDGARTGSNQLAQDKGLSAASFRIATADMARIGSGYIPGIIVAGGGVPFLSSAGDALGGVGVSGGTAEEDIACGKAGVEAAGLRPAGK